MNTITTPLPDVPLPAGADWPDEGLGWQPDDPPRQSYRVIYGASRGIDGHDLVVWTLEERFKTNLSSSANTI